MEPIQKREMTRMGPIRALVWFWLWFPMVTVAVLLGVAFGWEIPVAVTLGFASFLALASRAERKVGATRATMEFAGFALLGGVVGALLLGGLGAIFGFVLGLVGRLAQVPLTGGPSFRVLRRRRR